MAGGEKYFEDLFVGDSAEKTTLITVEMVRQFAQFSGDDNPSHVDPAYAANHGLEQPSVHGMLYVSLLSGVLGAELPGHASVYLSQTVRFHGPVHVGDHLRARVEVAALDDSSGQITLRTTCDVGGALVMEGEALMRLPRRPSA